jgi:hypothetical protein
METKNFFHVAGITCEYKNEFHANWMKFGDFGEKIFFWKF